MTFLLTKSTTLLLLSVVFISCTGSPKSLYYWGEYEDSIYDIYLEPGKSSLTDEILRLEEQVQQAANHGKPVPPGLHAHLGYLYANDGDYNTAVIHFKREKEKFPESADFIDGMLKRMKK
jgi:hypothetical protein